MQMFSNPVAANVKECKKTQVTVTYCEVISIKVKLYSIVNSRDNNNT